MPSDFEKNKEQELDRYGVWIKSGPQDVNAKEFDENSSTPLTPPVEILKAQDHVEPGKDGVLTETPEEPDNFHGNETSPLGDEKETVYGDEEINLTPFSDIDFDQEESGGIVEENELADLVPESETLDTEPAVESLESEDTPEHSLPDFEFRESDIEPEEIAGSNDENSPHVSIIQEEPDTSSIETSLDVTEPEEIESPAFSEEQTITVENDWISDKEDSMDWTSGEEAPVKNIEPEQSEIKFENPDNAVPEPNDLSIDFEAENSEPVFEVPEPEDEKKVSLDIKNAGIDSTGEMPLELPDLEDGEQTKTGDNEAEITKVDTSEPDFPDFSAFMSESELAEINNMEIPKPETKSASSSSGGMEEISMDDFGLGDDFSEISLDDFMSDGSSSQSNEKQAVFEDVPPLNIDLEFDDEFIEESKKMSRSQTDSDDLLSQFFDDDFGVEIIDQSTGSSTTNAGNNKVEIPEDTGFDFSEIEGFDIFDEAPAATENPVVQQETVPETQETEVFESGKTKDFSVEAVTSSASDVTGAAVEDVTSEFDDILSELGPSANQGGTGSSDKIDNSNDINITVVVEDEDTEEEEQETEQGNLDEEEISVPIYIEDSGKTADSGNRNNAPAPGDFDLSEIEGFEFLDSTPENEASLPGKETEPKDAESEPVTFEMPEVGDEVPDTEQTVPVTETLTEPEPETELSGLEIAETDTLESEIYPEPEESETEAEVEENSTFEDMETEETTPEEENLSELTLSESDLQPEPADINNEEEALTGETASDSGFSETTVQEINLSEESLEEAPAESVEMAAESLDQETETENPGKENVDMGLDFPEESDNGDFEATLPDKETELEDAESEPGTFEMPEVGDEIPDTEQTVPVTETLSEPEPETELSGLEIAETDTLESEIYPEPEESETDAEVEENSAFEGIEVAETTPEEENLSEITLSESDLQPEPADINNEEEALTGETASDPGFSETTVQEINLSEESLEEEPAESVEMAAETLDQETETENPGTETVDIGLDFPEESDKGDFEASLPGKETELEETDINLEEDNAGITSGEESQETAIETEAPDSQGETVEENLETATASEIDDSSPVNKANEDNCPDYEEYKNGIEEEKVVLEETMNNDFDDVKAVEQDLLETETVKTVDEETSVLKKIAEELSSIKNEITTLKSELNNLKTGEQERIEQNIETEQENDNIAIPDGNSENTENGFFGDDDSDEAIALTGDELNNILTTADFTEEEAGITPESETETVIETETDDDDISPETSVDEDTPTQEEEISDFEKELFEKDDKIFDEEKAFEDTAYDKVEAVPVTKIDDTEYLDGDEEAVTTEELAIDEADIPEIDFNDEVLVEPEETEITDTIKELEIPEVPATEESEETIEEDTVSETTEPENTPEKEDSGVITEELKGEIKTVLAYMDQLLENLPESKIEEFAKSEHFHVYKKLFDELGLS